ncbi:response regulator transcription factor [Stenotrophomonas sp.]|uniref:response regulator transcription factor n=1 Tax=Stenotrophomonas sp. TaxID=69392 RepID=UPI0028A05395|nr:response regulator transcription factor [Stenotrophomonas sp.]
MNGHSADATLKIALLDDHDVVRHGTRIHLSNDWRFDVVGSHGHSNALLTTLASRPVDVAIVDYALSATDVEGLALVRQIRQRHPRVGILVFSAHVNRVIITSALHAGANGVVTKNDRLDELARAIVQITQGESYMPPEYGCDPDESHLSNAEREVLQLCMTGMTVSEIALKRHRSIKTISTQKHAAFRKLGLRSDGDLYTLRHQLGNL